MMGDMPLDTAAIMSTVLEGVLYGFSVLMFVGTMWTLTYERHTQEVNRPIAAVAIMLLLLSTAHIVVDIIRVEEGFVRYRDTFPGGPPAFFADIAQRTFVIKNAIYIMQTLLGDGVVIYRCYVVWRSMSIVVLPSILWCSVGVTGTIAVYSVSQATSNAGDIFVPATGQWIKAFFASTLATNMLSSGLLAYRIWKVECNVSQARTTSRSPTPVLRVLVDAALLYSVTLLSALVCFAFSNNGQFVMIDMIVPIISIAFYMILIRISMKRPLQEYHSRGGATGDTARGNLQQLTEKPLQVYVSQIMQKDTTAAHHVIGMEAGTYGMTPPDVSY